MACCEYTCKKCRFNWFENGASTCPKCGNTDLYVIYDEDGLDDKKESESENE
jgi:hypothetical protein